MRFPWPLAAVRLAAVHNHIRAHGGTPRNWRPAVSIYVFQSVHLVVLQRQPLFAVAGVSHADGIVKRTLWLSFLKVHTDSNLLFDAPILNNLIHKNS